MQLSVLRELRQRVGSVSICDIQEQLVRLNDVELRGVTGALTLLRTDIGILASFVASATIQENCARCLTQVECALDITFEEEYIPVIDAETGARLLDNDSEEQFSIGPDFVLDLREGIRQYVLMSEPAKPLCRPDCAGLCATCGAELNGARCTCTPATDERLETLEGLEMDTGKGS
jgi:uncharacterized protein